MARRSSLPKRTEKPFVAAYCSAAIAAAMLEVSACSRFDAAECPFDGFGAVSPFVLPFTGGRVSEGGMSLESLSFFYLPFDEPPVALLSFSSADGDRFPGLDAEFDQLASDHRWNVHQALVRQSVHDLFAEPAFHLEAVGVSQCDGDRNIGLKCDSLSHDCVLLFRLLL
jgi:hypothetical protein